MDEEEEDLYDNYDEYFDEENQREAPIPQVIHQNSMSPWSQVTDGVTTLYKCEASSAKNLYVFDIGYKLLYDEQYDIGGAYKEGTPAFWFFFTTTLCPGSNHLMNIFVCQRQPGMFTLGMSNSNIPASELYKGDKVVMLPDDLDWFKYSSTQPDTVHYIKTFRFSDKQQQALENNILIIPLKIDLSPKNMLKTNEIQIIKMEHEFGKPLFKDQDPDFILKSSTGKEFKVHKIVLAAHSPVIRDSIRAKDCNTLNISLSDEETAQLVEYLYSGKIDDMLELGYEKLFEIADTFQLNNLLVLVQYAIKASINSSNVLSIAVITEKYNYKDIQEVAFKYIKAHPDVLKSEAFSEINDANLIKKLLKYIHIKC